MRLRKKIRTRRRALAGLQSKRRWICDGGADPLKMTRKERSESCRLVTVAELPIRRRRRSSAT